MDSLAFLRRLLAPDPTQKPFVVVLHHGALLLRLVDAVPEAFIYDHLHRYAAILERLSQFVGVRYRHSLIQFAVLNQCRRLRILYVRDGRSLLIYLSVIPRRRLQILSRERMNVGVHVISHPIRNTGAYRNRLEPIAAAGDEGGNVAALAPAHRADAIAVDHALRDQMIDAGYDVPVISNTKVAHIERSELLAVAGRAAIVRPQNNSAPVRKHFDRIIPIAAHNRSINSSRSPVNDHEKRVFL